MKTGMALALICIGAIFAFAVTASNSVVNLRTAGFIVLIIGIIGLVIPRRSYGWISQRLVRRTRHWPGGRRVEETDYPSYVVRTPGELPAAGPDDYATAGRKQADGSQASGNRAGATTEVIEDIYQE
jgi:hypothetical protein